MIQLAFFLLSLFCYLPLNYSIQPDVLAKKIRNGPPQWMTYQIQKDLKKFQERGIYEEDLINTVAVFAHRNPLDQAPDLSMSDPLTMRCKIINRRIYLSYGDQHLPVAYNSRIKSVLYALKFLSTRYFLPPLDFIISVHDGVDYDSDQLSFPAPLFTFAKNKHNTSAVAFPDAEMIGGYKHLINDVLHASTQIPFAQKIPKAFWRGSTTGGTYTVADWNTFPRSRLVIFAKNHPELVDAQFTHVTQTPPHENLKQLLKEQGLLSHSVSVPDHLPFKYLIDIDGNSCTYSRFIWILFSNSLCLKQVSNNEQWYYGGLKPYVHYLPFNSDMSDFGEKIAWAEAHPEEVQTMIHNANIFARDNLTQEDAFHYIYELLMSYAKLQKFIPKTRL